MTTPTDPVPAEIASLREAVWAATASPADDVPAYWRAVAAAKRDLSAAYAKAARLVPDDTLLRAAMTDALYNLQDVARNHEMSAVEFENAANRAESRGQA